jgi:CheY-like chemotaxis protein
MREDKAGQAGRDIFVAAMTAHAMSGDRAKCMEMGMDHYISKPVGLHDFRRALELAAQKAEIVFEPVESKSIRD